MCKYTAIFLHAISCRWENPLQFVFSLSNRKSRCFQYLERLQYRSYVWGSLSSHCASLLVMNCLTHLPQEHFPNSAALCYSAWVIVFDETQPSGTSYREALRWDQDLFPHGRAGQRSRRVGDGLKDEACALWGHRKLMFNDITDVIFLKKEDYTGAKREAWPR